MMNRTFRRLTAVLLTLCMALTLLPVSAFAEGETQTGTVVSQPDQIAGVTLTAEAAQWPEDGEKPADLTITAANQYALSDKRLYLELQGAPNTNYYYSADESNLQTNGTSTDGTGWSGFYYALSNAEAGSLSVKLWFSVDTDNDGTLEYVFGPVEVNTYLAEQLPALTVEDMENKITVLSTCDIATNLNVTVPADLLPSGASLELRLYGHDDGLLYGRTEASNKPSFSTSQKKDPRYAGIFERYNQKVSCANVYGYLYFGRALLDTQSYDLKICSGGEVLAVLDELVRVSSLPVVTMSSSGQLGVNQAGITTAYIQLTIKNGDARDYAVSVYAADSGELLGTSGDFCISSADSRQNQADYIIPLSAPLQANVGYLARLESKVPSAGDSELSFNTSTSKRVSQMVYASGYYASIVLQTYGFSAGSTYLAELKSGSAVLATVTAQCGEDGVFDLEFLDENGSPLSLTTNTTYYVNMKENRNGQWLQVASKSVRFQGADTGTSTGGASEYANLNIFDGGRVGFSANLSDVTYGQLDVDQLALRLVRFDEESVLVELDKRESKDYTDGQIHYYRCSGPIPAGWENAYVFAELLYQGQPVLNAQQVNVLKKSYVTLLDTGMGFYTMDRAVNGPRYVYALSTRNTGGQTATVELFRFGNNSPKPDASFTVSAADSYRFPVLPDANSPLITPYSVQVRVDGKIVSGNRTCVYPATETVMNSGATYSVSAQSADHGKVRLIDPATGEEVTSAKALSEVYVCLTAEDGYQLKSGSVRVNGQSILGRAIRVNGDCTVSAEFEEIPAARYDITCINSINGTCTVQESAAAGEKVIVSVNPNEGRTVDLAQSYIYYYAPNYTQELLQRDEAGNYYFIMPESGVNLSVYFRSIRTPSLGMYFNKSSGGALAQFVTFTKEDGTAVSHNEKVTEGTVINVRAQLHPELDGIRQDFGGMELSYSHPTTGENVRVPVELDENGCGSFVVPNASGVDIYTTYIPYQQFRITANHTAVKFDFESGDGAYYPNETVRFRLTFNEGCVQNGAPQYSHPVTGENVELIPDEDGWYSLTMPAQDLTIYCDYRYVSQYRLYISDVSSYCSVYLNGDTSPVSSSGASVYESSQVALHIQPNAGYRLVEGSVYVQDYFGNRTDLTYGEDGLYHFTMPSTYVYLHASFEPVPTYYVSSRYSNCEFVSGRSYYEEGEIVTVQFTGPEGYVMDAGYPKVTYPYHPYEQLDVEMTPLGNNRYRFPMPAQECKVEAVFVETPRYTAQAQATANSLYVHCYETSGRTVFEEGETATFVFSISQDYVMAPGYPKVTSQQTGQELDVTVTSLGNGTYSFPVPAESCYLLYEVREGTRYNVGVTTSGGEGYVQPSEFNPVAGKTVWVTAQNYAYGGWVNLTCATASGAEVALTYHESSQQYSFVMPEENVTLRAEFVKEREVPGGVVTDLDSLLAALGGPACVNYYTWDSDGETNAAAELRGNLKLQSTLDIQSGGVSLSLAGYTLRYDGAADAPAVSVGANVPRFDLVGSVWTATGAPMVGRVVSNGPAVQTADNACADQYLEIVGGWYTSAQNAALKLGGTTANVTVGGSPVYANTESADHYAVELTGKLEKGWLGNLLAWSDSGRSIRLPEGDSLTNYLTYQDEKGNTMDPVEVFAIDGAITPVMDIDMFMGMDVPGWTGESLPESALSASAYEQALFLTQPYTISFSEDTQASKALCDSLTLPAQKQANGLWIAFSVEPKFGCSTEHVQYFPPNNESQIFELWKDKETGLYGFAMPNYDIELDVLVKEIPQSEVLYRDTYLAGQKQWDFSLNNPGNFDYDSGYVKVTVLDEQGNFVDRQESHRGYTSMSYFQPGLAPGRYKVYVTVGDQWSQKEMGWQWINVIDGVSYNCNMDGRWNLTTETRSFRVNAWVDAAAVQLPGDLRLEVVDVNTQQVLYTQSSYSVTVCGNEGTEDGKTSGANKGEGIQNSTNLIFDVALEQTLPEGSTVALRLASDQVDFVENGSNTYPVTSNFYIGRGEMDMSTRIWTTIAECVPAGDFYAYSQNDPDRAVLYPVHIENNIMTVDFSGNWPFGENNSYLWMSVDFGGDFGSRGFDVSVPTENTYYSLTVDNAYEFYGQLDSRYVEWIISQNDVGDGLTVRLDGASGAGRYEVYCDVSGSGSQLVTSGQIADLSSFRIPLTAPAAERNYLLQVYDQNEQYVSGRNVYITALPTLLPVYKRSTDDAFVVRTLNMDDAQRALLRMGYTSSEGGRVKLPVTVNGDGTVTLDLSGLPIGTYRLWGHIEAEPYQEVRTGRNMTLEKLPERQQAAVQVSDPVTSNNVTTATVTYSGTPAGSVTMSVYEAAYIDDYQQSLTFVKNVNIGAKTYTINSKTLGLNGLYALYFTDESGACLGAVMMQMGAPVYTVTFRDGRDNSLLYTVRVAEGQAVQMPAVPAKVGFSFTGWYDGPDDKGDHALADLSCVTEDCTVYAHYARNKYEVVFANWDGTTLCTQDVKYGNWPELDSVPAPSDREGYVFEEWDLSALEKNGGVTGNIVIYPIFAKAEITVKLELLGGTLPEDQTATFTVKRGESAFGDGSRPVPEREGYVFALWQTDPQTETPYTGEALYRDTVLYAKWRKAPRAITVDAADEVTVKAPDSAVPGETVTLAVDMPAYMSVESVVLTYYGGSGTLLTVRDGLTSFVMPDADVTVTVTAVENEGALTICFPNYIPETTTVICYDPYSQDVFGKEDVKDGTYAMSGLPKGTYYVTVSDGSYTQTKTVTLSGEKTVTFDLAQPGTYEGVVNADAGIPENLWLYFYDMEGRYVTGTWVNEKDGSFKVDSLPMGQYTVEAWGKHTYALADNTVTVDGDTESLSLILLPTADLTVTLHTASQLGKYAYLMLEKWTGTGWAYVSSGLCGSEDGTTYLFEDVLTAAGEKFRVTLTNLTRNYYSGSVRFDAEPVELTVAPEELTNGTRNVELLYQMPDGTLADLSGEGNLVAANRTDVNPGDVVDVVIRFQSGETLVSPIFTFGAHSGLTRLDEQTLTAEEASFGSFHTTFRVGADAKGVLELPVYVKLEENGERVLFGTVNLTVNKVTLTAPAQVESKMPFTVYGEAPEGSVVNIRDGAEQVLATVPVTGRFYSVELSLTDAATLTAEVNGLRSEPVSVSVTSEPVTVDAVRYGDYGAKAAFNSRLNAYSFWQYVDMRLEGFDLPVQTRFTNPDNVKSVTYHFCGVDAPAGLDETDDTWYGVFPQGAWGGSGLKALTATVETRDDQTLEMTVAMVNLLIDPSGVVTDENGKPLEGVTVICQVWDADHNAWEDFDAESVGQVNPQITDSEGRYGWFVNEGRYRILASKEGYADYDSLLDSDPNNSSIVIPPARNDVNFVMHAINDTYHVLRGTVENAEVTLKSAEVKGGDTVRLTVTADEKFAVKSVSVRTVSGKRVEVGEDYTFIMPNEDVVYSVSAEPASKPALGPTVTAEVNDGKLTVTVENLKLEYAKLMVAFYDASGRMIGVRMNVQSEVAVISGAAKARVFLLNDNLPVMQSVEVPL